MRVSRICIGIATTFFTPMALLAQEDLGERSKELVARFKDEGALHSPVKDELIKIGAPAIPTIIDALEKSTNPKVRVHAAFALSLIPDPRAVTPLIAALADENREVRRYAAEALGKNRDSKAVGPLLAALEDKDPMVRASTARALGSIGEPKAFQPLLDLLKDKDRKVLAGAVEGLGNLGDTRAIEHIIGLANVKNRSFEDLVILAFKKMGKTACPILLDYLQSDDPATLVNAMGGLAVIGEARAVEPILEKLGHDDLMVRITAAHALGMLKDSRAVEPLLAAMKQVRGWDLVAMVWALGEIGDPAALEPLFSYLQKDRHPQLHKDISRAIGRIGEPVVGPLTAKLKDLKEAKIRILAAELLGLVGSRTASGPLCKALRDPDEEVRMEAARALGRIKDEGTVENLAEALSDESKWVRLRVRRALEAFGVKAAEPLLRKLESENALHRAMATLVLGNLHWKPAFEPLTRLLGDPVSEVRRCAALALGGFGEAKEGDWLLPLLKDPEEEVVKAARFALVELKDPRVLPHLVSALKDGPRHERDDILKAIGEVPDQSLVPLFIPMAKANTSIAAAATKVLAKLDCSKYPGDVVEIFRIRPSHSFGCEYKMVLKLGQSAEPFLIEALKDERRGVRFLSAELLGKVGTQKSVFPLIDLFGDRDSTVRERAEKALKELNSNNVSLEGTSERLLHLLDKKRYRMWDEPLAILRLTKDRQVIGTLIEKLNSCPRGAEDKIRGTLAVITGEKGIYDYRDWKAWWDEQKGK